MASNTMCSRAPTPCATTLSIAASMKVPRSRVGVMTEIVTMLAGNAVPDQSCRGRLFGKEIVVLVERLNQPITQRLEIIGQTRDVAAFDQHVAKPESGVIDALQHFDFRAFD